MKNVQVIEAGPGSTFSVFQMSEDEFQAVFPGAGQDIEFAEELFERLGDEPAEKLLAAVWTRPVLKSTLTGLHGTLLYGFSARRHHYPESKCERDYDPSRLNEHQRKLFGK